MELLKRTSELKDFKVFNVAGMLPLSCDDEKSIESTAPAELQDIFTSVQQFDCNVNFPPISDQAELATRQSV